MKAAYKAVIDFCIQRKKHIVMPLAVHALYVAVMFTATAFPLNDYILSLFAKHTFTAMYIYSGVICLIVYFKNNMSLLPPVLILICTLILMVLSTLILSLFDVRIPVFSEGDQVYVIERIEIATHNLSIFIFCCLPISLCLLATVIVSKIAIK